MDPISQGVLGAAVAATVPRREKLVAAAWLGALAGMAPDLDVFIQSPHDPLLFLEFHRQFTHALAFIPLGALVVAGSLYRLFRSHLTWREAYLVALAGYATHGLLDACTTYGTQLFWPFSDMRVAWNNVSVVDPAFTLPLLVLVVLAARRRRPAFAWWGVAWAVGYLLVGVVQHERAYSAALTLADSRGHEGTRLSVKPGFANLLLWKATYEHEGMYFVDGVRAGFPATVCPGDRIAKLDLARHLPDLDPNSQQARDLERFRWFSADWLAVAGEHVIDIRYSMVPNEIDGLWGIRLDPGAPDDAHVEWWSDRNAGSDQTRALAELLTGRACERVAGTQSTRS